MVLLRWQQKSGIVSPAELKRLADAGDLRPNDLVWRDGMTNWSAARNVRGLFEAGTDGGEAAEAGSPFKESVVVTRGQCNEPFDVVNRMTDFVGQAEIIEAIERRLDNVSKLGLPFPHTLFCGPPDFGKVTLALLIARDLGVGYQIASATALTAPKDIITYLTNGEERSILLIEDIDSFPETMCEFLVPAMEDFRIDMTLGEGVNARTVNMSLRPFTLIGTSSRPSRVNRKLLSWFTTYNFKPYTEDEFSQIVRIMALRNRLDLPVECVPLVISCCGGSLADAAMLLKRIRGYLGENVNLAPEVLRTTLDLLGYEGERTCVISLQDKLRSMTGVEFEEFVALLFQRQDYRVEYTKTTGDHGVDLLLRKNNKLTAAQCKRWEGTVGEPIVRDFYGSMISCGADMGIIVTTAYFTPQAVAFAANKPITLMDLDSLLHAGQGVHGEHILFQ